jgi:protein involved in polysaccharide export with SLBB domain
MHTRTRRHFMLLMPALAVIASACSVTTPADINEVYREVIDQRHNHYQVKDGDQLTIAVFNRPGDMNQADLLVLPDGRCDIFFMGNPVVAGKTIPELEVELKTRMAHEVRDPSVNIQVKPRQETIYVVGEFEDGGSAIALNTKMTLHEAISAAAGLKITGDTDWALLRRPYGNPRHPTLYRIDLNDESEEIFLLPDDQIILGRNFFAGVINYVRTYIFGVFPDPFQGLFAAGLIAG